MKYALFSLALFTLLAAVPLAGARAEDAPDAAKLLSDLQMANKEKDSSAIDGLTKPIAQLAEQSKNQKELDPIAKELSSSVKICKGNWGTLKKIVSVLGDLRSKNGLKALKRLAYAKEPGDDDELSLQIAAIDAVGKLRDKRQINGLSELTKHKMNDIAKAAYAAFKHYEPVKGKTRRKIAEMLMKRISLEYPASGGQGGKTVSAEKQARWQEIQPVLVETLQALCRQNTITTIEDWREWWKENDSGRSKAWKDPKRNA